MHDDVINSDDATAKPKKKYPIKHKRPNGQIIERGKNRFMVWLHSHTDAEGKPQRYTKTFPTLKEADLHLTQKLAEKNRGKAILDTSERFSDFIEKYLTEIHAPNVRPQSNATLRAYFQYYVLPYLGHRRVRDLTPLDFQTLYNKLRESVGSKTKRPLSQTTIRKVHIAVNLALKSAVYHGKLSNNPAEKASAGRAKHKEILILTAAQVREFLEIWQSYEVETSRHFAKHSLGSIWQLGFETGMRPEEITGLRWKDLNLDATPPMIHIQQVAVRSVRLKGFHFGEPKTKKSRRAIPITQELARALNEQKALVEKMHEKVQSRWKDYGLVFPNTTGEPLYDYRLRLLFKKIIEKMGLDQSLYSLYTMRHTMASLALAHNINPKVVAERLGHENVLQTLNTYSHVIPSLQADATEIIGAALYGTQETSKPVEPQSVPDES